MSQRSLENFLRKLTGQDSKKAPEEDWIEVGDSETWSDPRNEERLIVLQRIVEKILGYMFTTIETTETRLSGFQGGINNINAYLNQQLHDMVARLRELPGMAGLKEVTIPDVSFGHEPGAVAGKFMDTLTTFIENAAREIASQKASTVASSGAPPAPVPVAARPASDVDVEKLSQKQAELSEKERFLNMLAEQLASKELQLQERESTIEIIESGLEDKIKLTAALQIAGKKEGSEEDLAELSKLSDAILQGDIEHPEDDDLNGIDPYMDGDADGDDDDD